MKPLYFNTPVVLENGDVIELNELLYHVKALSSDNAGTHNSIYRGQYLGDKVTDEQYKAISSGKFTNLYIGDYWTIDNIDWRIAGFDYYLNTGDQKCTVHHIVIVPDKTLYDYVMNDTNTTVGGYANSKMRVSGLEQAKTLIKRIFSGHVLKHRIFLVNNISNGRNSSCAWYDSEVELMNEQMIYGCGILSPVSDGTNVPANYRVEKSQLPLFSIRHDLISNGGIWWLRDILSNAYFEVMLYNGTANDSNASNSLGVRPSFCIY